MQYYLGKYKNKQYKFYPTNYHHFIYIDDKSFNNPSYNNEIFNLYSIKKSKIINTNILCKIIHADGNLRMTKWILRNYDTLKKCSSDVYKFDPFEIFMFICKYNNIKLAKYLIKKFTYEKVFEKTDSLFEHNGSFIIACENGHLKLAKWLLKINKNLAIGFNTNNNSDDIIDENIIIIRIITNIINKLVKLDYIYVLKWFYKKFINNDILNKINELFINDISIIEYDVFPSFNKNNNIKTIKWILKRFFLSTNKNVIIKFFHISCILGDLKIAKWLFKKYSNFILYENYVKTFKITYYNEHKNIVKWLLKKYPDLLTYVKNNFNVLEYPFHLSNDNCLRHNNLKILNVLTKLVPKYYIKYNYVYEDILNQYCYIGDLKGIKKLIKVYPQINIHYDNDDCFITATIQGKINVIKWFIKNYTFKIEVIESFITDNLIISSSYLQIIKLLLKKYPEINIYKYEKKLICRLFLYNDIYTIKWFSKNYPKLDININDNFAYKDAYTRRNKYTVNWLLKNWPELINVNIMINANMYE